jgi:hypothetical protein
MAHVSTARGRCALDRPVVRRAERRQVERRPSLADPHTGGKEHAPEEAG